MTWQTSRCFASSGVMFTVAPPCRSGTLQNVSAALFAAKHVGRGQTRSLCDIDEIGDCGQLVLTRHQVIPGEGQDEKTDQKPAQGSCPFATDCWVCAVRSHTLAQYALHPSIPASVCSPHCFIAGTPRFPSPCTPSLLSSRTQHSPAS